MQMQSPDESFTLPEPMSQARFQEIMELKDKVDECEDFLIVEPARIDIVAAITDLQTECMRLLAESSRFTPMDIESAPQDGTEILAWCPRRGWRRAKWQDDEYSVKPRPYWMTESRWIRDDRNDQPTHYIDMLPSPTENASG